MLDILLVWGLFLRETAHVVVSGAVRGKLLTRDTGCLKLAAVGHDKDETCLTYFADVQRGKL